MLLVAGDVELAIEGHERIARVLRHGRRGGLGKGGSTADLVSWKSCLADA